MTTSNLSIVMAPNLLWPSSVEDQQGTTSTTPGAHVGAVMDFSESNLANDIVESLIVNVHHYFGEENVDFFQDPPTLIGSKRMSSRNNGGGGSQFTPNATGKTPSFRDSLQLGPQDVDAKQRFHHHGNNSVANNIGGSIPASRSQQQDQVNSVNSLSTTTTTTVSSPGNTNNHPQITPKPQILPVPAQRTPVPKPRGSKSGYGKSTNPPPRPTERPNIHTERPNPVNLLADNTGRSNIGIVQSEVSNTKL